MAAPGKTVYVLGAGFTKAFVPEAPLIVDHFGVLDLREKVEAFPYAEFVLEEALREYGNDGRVNLEKLMTRLTGMPYDNDDARRELALVGIRLRKALIAKLEQAKAAGTDTAALHAFARLALTQQASIVSFNYDDVLDQALWVVGRSLDGNRATWHPDGGYGFYCRPSDRVVHDAPMFMNICTTLLLKLHGSLNWRSPIGEPTPRAPSGVHHHELWFTDVELDPPILAQREEYLEPDPLIVPPLLVKSELTLHPVLRVVWNRARAKLAEADSVVFIGYSLPLTDLASRTLFEETLNRPKCEIHVVNKAQGGQEKDSVERAYRGLFLGRELQFSFDGAREWLRRAAPDDPSNKAAA